jgi:Na+/melibiose symporter-like transporter
VDSQKNFEFNGQAYDLGGLSITPWSVSIGLVLLILFYFWEKQMEAHEHREPLVSMDIFKNRQFSVSIAMIATIFSGFTGIITFGVVLYYQRVLNLSAFDSGIGLMALSAASFVAAPLSARLGEKISTGRTVQLGLLIGLVGNILLYFTLQNGPTRLSLTPALFIFGFGFGLITSQLSNLVLSAVPTYQAGEASGLNGTIREVGRSLGTAIIGAIFITTFTNSVSDYINTKSAIPAPVKQAITTQVKNSNGNIENKTSIDSDSSLPTQIKMDIQDAFNQGTISASRYSVAVTTLFIVGGLGLSLLLSKSSFTPYQSGQPEDQMTQATA